VAARELRLVVADDSALLWRMLTFAASMPDAGSAASVAAAQADPFLASYVLGWGRPGDLGLVAVPRGQPVGVAWLRRGDGSVGPFKVSTEAEPELAIAVEPAHRGAGIGRALLEELLRVAAEQRVISIVLSVRVDNPSVRLYERVGFATVRRIPNRAGGDSLVMRRHLGS
jgi:ribosomal protein S18 acetylase RimI-like enzyme